MHLLIILYVIMKIIKDELRVSISKKNVLFYIMIQYKLSNNSIHTLI